MFGGNQKKMNALTDTPVIKLDNLLTEQELATINELFDANIPENSEEFGELGRLNVLLYGFPTHLVDKLTNIVNASRELSDPSGPLELVLAPSGAEYNSKYGSPVLRPHYDGDWTEVIIDFQLSSSTNTEWPLGVDLNTYTLDDNSGIAFNPNKGVHWRPHKNFQPGEYVRMIFFRFFNPNNPQNNDDLNEIHPTHEALIAVADYRDALDY